MLALEHSSPFDNGLQATHIERRAQHFAESDFLVHIFLMPRAELVGLDHIAAIEAPASRTCDHSSGMQQHDVFDDGFGMGPARDAESLYDSQEHGFMALALLQWGFDAVAPISILYREFTLFIDDQVAIEGLGFDQVENKPSTHDQVIDLGDLPVIDQTQVVQNDVILTVMEIGVDVVGGISLASNAVLNPLVLSREPVALAPVQHGCASQLFKETQAFALVVG